MRGHLGRHGRSEVVDQKGLHRRINLKDNYLLHTTSDCHSHVHTYTYEKAVDTQVEKGRTSTDRNTDFKSHVEVHRSLH